MDSGAAESVSRRDWATEFPTKEVAWKPEEELSRCQWLTDGAPRRECCEVDGLSAPVSMKFQVSDARNPLASVAWITEHGIIVHFGPKDEDNCIFNPRTEEKAMMRRKGEVCLRCELRQEETGFQWAWLERAPKLVPPASTVPRVGNEGTSRAVRLVRKDNGIDRQTDVMEQDEESEN